MARQYVMVKVPAAERAAVNDFLVSLFGDDPGSEEITLNAYAGGQDPAAATHCFSNMNVSQADATAIATEMANHAGCDQRHRDNTLGSWTWEDALLVWDLRPVVPVTP